MAQIPGSVTLTGFIAPTDDADVYATHDDFYGRGGYRSVVNQAARNAIPTDRRKEGMVVHVLDENVSYQLFGGTTNSHWIVYTTATPDTTISLIAAENVSPYRALIIDAAGKVWHADKDSITDRDRVIGINKNATGINDLTELQTTGAITNQSWSFNPGPVFVNTAGTLTQVEPTSGYVVKMGIALSATKLLIDIDKIGYIEIGIDEVDGGTF